MPVATSNPVSSNGGSAWHEPPPPLAEAHREGGLAGPRRHASLDAEPHGTWTELGCLEPFNVRGAAQRGRVRVGDVKPVDRLPVPHHRHAVGGVPTVGALTGAVAEAESVGRPSPFDAAEVLADEGTAKRPPGGVQAR